ncbi:hypothetical protein [Streptomyces sp. NPDC000405]|uniref:hypothetical protein n=1 Tax=Streptomyces sp. NPDC000405 TaxID=3161033 RepID=UPI00398D1245
MRPDVVSRGTVDLPVLYQRDPGAIDALYRRMPARFVAPWCVAAQVREPGKAYIDLLPAREGRPRGDIDAVAIARSGPAPPVRLACPRSGRVTWCRAGRPDWNSGYRRGRGRCGSTP